MVHELASTRAAWQALLAVQNRIIEMHDYEAHEGQVRKTDFESVSPAEITRCAMPIYRRTAYHHRLF